MTGHKGNSEFCFLEKLNVPRGGAYRKVTIPVFFYAANKNYRQY